MYRSGFSGTIGAWTPGSGGNPGMLAATVNGTLSLTAAFNSEVRCQMQMQETVLLR